MDRIKVVWICSVSNPEIRAHIKVRKSHLESLMRKAVKSSQEQVMDSAIWNTNGINEMKKIPDVELHIVSATRNLATTRQDFDSEGIHYHFIRDENSSIIRKIVRYLLTRYTSDFKNNRKNICRIVNEIKPDLVHVIGAENPQYSLALLDLPASVPTILQLQALLVSIVDKTSGDQRKEYEYKGQLEKQLITRADFVGTKVPSFIEFIRKNIKHDTAIVNTTLAMAQTLNLTETEKEFDFVHYAATLGESKATDVAIEAFGIAHQVHPEITLDLIGNMTSKFKEKVTEHLTALGIESAVTFEGRLATHDDVIAQIRKAKYALLPLKVSIVPNTLHEAMANGLPVLTTVTPGTPKLNEQRESVLISPQGDAKDLARNMIRLVKDPELAGRLRENAAKTEQEQSCNREIIEHWVDVYNAVVRNKRDGTPIPQEFMMKQIYDKNTLR